MKFYNQIKWILGFGGGLMLIFSCSKERDPHSSVGTHEIVFQSDGVTRAEDVNAIPDPNFEFFPEGSSMGVFAFSVPDGIFDPNIHTPDLLYNASLTRLSTGAYLYHPVAHWPAKGKVRYAAYYPFSESYLPGVLTVTPYTISGLPQIMVDLSKAKNKVDFSVAVLDPLAPTKEADPVGTPPRNDYAVNFRFQRKIAELFFRAKVVDLDPLTNLYINAIAIKNIHTQGVYDMQNDGWTFSPDFDAVSGATIRFGSMGTPISKNEFVDIIMPGNIDFANRAASLVMFPQSYEHVEMTVTYTLEYMKADGGCEYRIIGTKKIPISVDWKAAKMYVYDLEFGFYEILGEKVPFKLTVKDWEKREIGTEIN